MNPASFGLIPEAKSEIRACRQFFVLLGLHGKNNMNVVLPAKRKAISKKTRFEVFKRDGFACQYCGAHPPSVILHVDHIKPVALGGLNEFDNFVTACEPCNLGKAARSLSDIPQSLKDKATQIKEREEQIQGYQSVMNGKRKRLDGEAEQVREIYEKFNRGITLTDESMVTVRNFINQLGLHEVREAMEKAYSRPSRGYGSQFKYFCGICWNKIREIV